MKREMLTVKPFVGSAGEAFFSCLFHNLNVLAFLLLLLIVLGWLAVLWLLLRGLGSIIFSLLLLLALALLSPTPSVPVAFIPLCRVLRRLDRWRLFHTNF
jgi:type IV secretory pathway VirB6-like protein